MTIARRLGWVGAGLLLVAALVLLLRPGAVAVTLAPVTAGPLQVTIGEEGETRVRDRYVVTAPVAGRLERIALQEGDSVSAGSIVARLYPAPLDARAREQALGQVSRADDAKRAADAAVTRLRAALLQSQRGLTRARELGQLGLIAPEERERAELMATSSERELEAADFQAQAAAHDVEVARAVLLGDARHGVPLRAPVRGQVLRIAERSERVVAAGEALLELGDPSRLEIVADLLSADAVSVRPGAPLLITGWGGPEVAGVVRRVEPSAFTKVSALGVEEQRVNVIGDFKDRPPALGDRFRVEVRIVIWESPKVLRAPASAVFRHGEGWAVFGVRSGRAALHQVEVGHRTPFEVELLGGVQAGDEVVRDPGDQLRDGARIRRR